MLKRAAMNEQEDADRKKLEAKEGKKKVKKINNNKNNKNKKRKKRAGKDKGEQ